jgi:hypothetical protein
MGYLKNHAKKIGLSKKAYDLVYEGLWDLYCKRPQTTDLNAKKLDGFVGRIKLSVPPQPVVPVEEEGGVKAAPTVLELKAIVRIRIPLKRPVPKVKDDEQEQEGNLDSSLNCGVEIDVKS